jgi:hypothetical protein
MTIQFVRLSVAISTVVISSLFFSIRPASADCGTDLAVYAVHDVVSHNLETSDTSSQELDATSLLNKYELSSKTDPQSLEAAASVLGFGGGNFGSITASQQLSLEELVNAATTHQSSNGTQFLDDKMWTGTLDPQVSAMYKSCLGASNVISSKLLVELQINPDFKDPSNDNVSLTIQNNDKNNNLTITTSPLGGINASCAGPIIKGTQNGTTLTLAPLDSKQLVCHRGKQLGDGSYPGFHFDVFPSVGNAITVALSALPAFTKAPPHLVTAVPLPNISLSGYNCPQRSLLY